MEILLQRQHFECL